MGYHGTLFHLKVQSATGVMSQRANQTAKRHSLVARFLQCLEPAGVRCLSVRAPLLASCIKHREHAVILRFFNGPSTRDVCCTHT